MKALALFSGGLDSTLAIKAIQRQGIEVVALYFLIPFTKTNPKELHNTLSKQINKDLKCEFKIIPLNEKYLEILNKPKHGYGKNLNPCIDCKILMLIQAKKMMAELGASFIITGEVLGQRPMSQNKRSLKTIERQSGLERLLVRPLSALLLPETIPQQKGWLKKEVLFGIEGRGRKHQISLAKQWNLEEYAQPAGGCLLTDPAFCKRLRNLMKHQELTPKDIELLKLGRYFRINDSFYLTVGRNEQENKILLELANNSEVIFEPVSLAGPTGVGRGVFDEEVKSIASQIIARYTDKGKEIDIKIFSKGDQEIIPSKSISEAVFKKLQV